MKFEWEPEKAARNLIEHDIAFVTVVSVIGDPLALTFSDPDHSIE